LDLKIKSLTEESGELRDAGHDTERIKALSDGVFAIALTLLVFRLKMPDLEGAEAQEVGARFGQQIPALIGFVMAFMILGVNWVIHTRILRHLQSYDRAILMQNLVVLFFVALMPYVTSLYGEYALGLSKDDPAAAQLTWTIYASTASILGICQASLWRTAHGRKHIDPNVTHRLAGYVSARIWTMVLIFVASIAVAHYAAVFYAALMPGLIPIALFWVHRTFERMPSDS